MNNDTLAHAVDTLRSQGSTACLSCTVCGGKALSIAVEATGLGGARGGWESYRSVDDFLLRMQTVEMKTRIALLVQSKHVVLSAQHLHHAGIAHALHGTGFSHPIPTMSLHKCRECAIVGQSLRLRSDAKIGLETEAALMDTIVRSRMLDDKLARLQCSSECCTDLIGKGTLLPFKTGVEETASPLAKILPAKTDAEEPAPPLAKMLYFSRKGQGGLQLGIVVWVVMESLPVVVLDDFAALFKTGEKLRTLNVQCNQHAGVFPRKCVVCNGTISTRLDAAFLGVDSKTSNMPGNWHAAHVLRCVHPCKLCGVWIPKVAPTFEEAMESERAVAMHARCHEFEACDARTRATQKKPIALLTSYPQERPDVKRKNQAGSLNKGYVPDWKSGRTGPFTTEHPSTGIEIDGIEPGDEKVVRRFDNTFARKRNVNGKIEYLPLDGQAFRGKDDRIEFYEYGLLVAQPP
jgi:hypothetical protein